MKAILDLFIKNKKKTFTSLLFVVLLSVLEVGIEYIKEEITKIKKIEAATESNAIRITNLEYKSNYYDDLIKTIVTRTSFDNYILRKDREMEEQNTFNINMISKLNKVDGRLDGLENIVYEINNYELLKERDK